jgi:long-subunit acyl-CoA synthetase (AMP-forming)
MFSKIAGFGMTETSPVTHFQIEEGSISGSCGFPVPNTLSKIVDVDTGKLLGPNQVALFV